MNYILTSDQLKTMAALLGADELFGLHDDGQILSRETMVRCVAELVRGGLLAPENGSFRCVSHLREMLQCVANPECVFLWTCPETGRQVEGCCAGARCTLLERLPGQKDAFRLIFRTREELAVFLEEEGFLPEEGGGGKNLLPAYFRLPAETLLAHGAALGVSGWVDVFDAKTHQRSARGMIYREKDALSFAAETVEKIEVNAYGKAALGKWLEEQTNGEAK